MKKISVLFITLLFTCRLFAQSGTPVVGYTFEQNNRGFLQQVKIQVLSMAGQQVLAETYSDTIGQFSFNLPPGLYQLHAAKDNFIDYQDSLRVGSEHAYIKIALQRKPGYLFDATLAEARETPDQIVDAISGATIEIFNRTQNRPELSLPRHPNAFFQFTFEQGNHYTMLIRKPGFIAKRIEVYVNIKGCILCVDGVRSVTPGVTDNLTAGHQMGTLLANIELEKARLDKRIQIQNIYYDYDKWDIRPDAAERLDQVVTLMQDNPGLSVELGSHTDSRGGDAYNLQLSQKRAESAVAYIVSNGVPSKRITAKGYGETQLVNRCRNGVSCDEAAHQQNRRTELRITGISADSLEYLSWKSLPDIVKEEQAMANAKAARKTAAASPQTLNILPLPKTQSGYGLEIADYPTPLGPDTPAFQGFQNIYEYRDAKGQYHYCVVVPGDLNKARALLNTTVRGKIQQAQLLQFVPGKLPSVVK